MKHRTKRELAVEKMWRERKFKYICEDCSQIWKTPQVWYKTKCWSCMGENFFFYVPTKRDKLKVRTTPKNPSPK